MRRGTPLSLIKGSVPPAVHSWRRLTGCPLNVVGEIKYHLGEKDFAHLKYSETKTSFAIDMVFVPSPHRSGGIGSFLINQVLALADIMGKDVYLSARPIGTSEGAALERLVSYYGRFGFEVYDRGQTVAYMMRKSARPGFTPAIF